MQLKKALLTRCREFLSRTRVSPERINPYLKEVGSAAAEAWLSLEKLLRRPEVSLESLFDFLKPEEFSSTELIKILPQVELEVKYDGYMNRELTRMEQLRRMEEVKIPPELDFSSLTTVSHEGRERLQRHRPATLGQASRVPGLTPGDLSVLMVEIGKFNKKTLPQ